MKIANILNFYKILRSKNDFMKVAASSSGDACSGEYARQMGYGDAVVCDGDILFFRL